MFGDNPLTGRGPIGNRPSLIDEEIDEIALTAKGQLSVRDEKSGGYQLLRL